MADDFYRIGQDLGGLIFRKRNQRWKDEQDEKDLKRKAFLQTLVEDAAMQREIEGNKSAMERTKYQENKQDYRAHAARGTDIEQAQIAAEQRTEVAKAYRAQQAAEEGMRILENEITNNRKQQEFNQLYPLKKMEAATGFGNALKQAGEVGYVPKAGMAEEAGWELEKKEEEAPSGGGLFGLFGGSEKPKVSVRPKFKLNGETIQTSPAAPNLPAPATPMPPTESGSRKSSMVKPDGLGYMGGRDLVEDLLSRLTNRAVKPAIKQ